MESLDSMAFFTSVSIEYESHYLVLIFVLYVRPQFVQLFHQRLITIQAYHENMNKDNPKVKHPGIRRFQGVIGGCRC